MKNKHLQKYSRFMFWWVGLPLLGVSALWCCIHHQNILANAILLSPFLLCIPFILLKTFEIENEFIINQVKEYRQMTTLEFAEAGIELEGLPIGKAKSMIREAYKIVYHERFLGNIVSKL